MLMFIMHPHKSRLVKIEKIFMKLYNKLFNRDSKLNWLGVIFYFKKRWVLICCTCHDSWQHGKQM